MRPEDIYRVAVDLVTADEHERAKLSDILHNGVLQAFGAAMLKAELARKLMGIGRYAEVEKELEQLRSSLASAVDNLRDILFVLRPPPVKERGLKLVLEELLDRSKIPGNGPPRLTMQPLGDIGDAFQSLIYRVVAQVIAYSLWICPKSRLLGVSIHRGEGLSTVTITFRFRDVQPVDELYGLLYLYWAPRLVMLNGDLKRDGDGSLLIFSFRLPEHTAVA